VLLVHTCGTVPAHGIAELAQPEPGYVIVGMKSYGRAPTFLLATGYQQVRSVVAALAGDRAEAAAVTRVRRPRPCAPATGTCWPAPSVAIDSFRLCRPSPSPSRPLDTGRAMGCDS
jgi:hypothetical protein